jgi:hypothetical protein
MKIEPVIASPDWEWLRGRSDVPGVVVRLRETGVPMTLAPETAEEVKAWVERVGWGPAAAPVRLVPLASSTDR